MTYKEKPQELAWGCLVRYLQLTWVESVSQVEIPKDYLNVNVRTRSLNNVNVNNVRATANKLVEAFNDPESFNYYCKVARALPENVIWTNMEQAKLKGRNPAAYFTTVCNIHMNDLKYKK